VARRARKTGFKKRRLKRRGFRLYTRAIKPLRHFSEVAVSLSLAAHPEKWFRAGIGEYIA